MTITIVLVILSFWILAKTSERNQRKKAARREQAERARRQREIERIQAEQRRMKEEQRRAAREQVEMDRAFRRMVAEQERQRREQERQAKEQERQTEILRKHEQRISDLEYRIEQAETDIEHWKQQVGNLYALRDVAMNELEQAIVGGKNQTKYQKQIITLDNQIHTAETRLAKAKHTKKQAEQQLAA